jgi:alcohol dehydrogenase class IV
MMIHDLHHLRGDWSYPTAIRFGPGRIAELPAVCRSVGITRPLLVTDPGLAALPMVQEAVACNEDAGVPTGVFSEIKSNPVARNVADGLAAYRDGAHDGIIAMGGGSAMDAGKVIALMAKQTRSLWDFDGDWRSIRTEDIAPVVAVPTTAGTGSEVGRAAADKGQNHADGVHDAVGVALGFIRVVLAQLALVRVHEIGERHLALASNSSNGSLRIHH